MHESVYHSKLLVMDENKYIMMKMRSEEMERENRRKHGWRKEDGRNRSKQHAVKKEKEDRKVIKEKTEEGSEERK